LLGGRMSDEDDAFRVTGSLLGDCGPRE